MTLAWWADGSLLWDTLILGGEVMPGLSAVTGDVARKLDIKPVKGTDGATMSDEGYEPGPIQIATRLFTQQQWTELQRLLPRFHPRAAGGTRSPLDIWHPAANLIGITTIYIRKIAMPVIDAKRVATVVIEAVQWFPAPKPATKNTKAPKGGGKIDPGDFNVPLPSTAGPPAVPL